MSVTRKERILDAIASGDLSDLPVPVTGEERSLDRIARAGWQNGVQSDWEQTDNTQADFIKNKPEIPDAQVNADWAEDDETSKAFIQNKPTIVEVSEDRKKLFLNSSTEDSEKVFAITVTDDGTLSADEVTE